MRFKVSDIVLAIFVLVVGFYLYNRFTSSDDQLKVTDSGVLGDVESDIEDSLGIQIPDDGEKIELSSGDSKAVVRKSGEDISIVADLPDLEPGQAYTVVGLGNLVSAKGGYILNSKVSSDFKDIEIKLGSKTILQGSF